MERLTRREPENNTQQVLNYAYASEKRVKLAYAGCTHGADLCEYIADQAADMGFSCAPTPDEVMEGDCMTCDCVFGVLNNVAIQAAELRARLMMIEDVLGDDYDLEKLRDLYGRQREERWIPVTERLPEPGVRVLATDGGFVGEFYINKRGQWQRYNVNGSSLLMALDILWWMPLPEGPGEGE